LVIDWHRLAVNTDLRKLNGKETTKPIPARAAAAGYAN